MQPAEAFSFRLYEVRRWSCATGLRHRIQRAQAARNTNGRPVGRGVDGACEGVGDDTQAW